MFADYFEVLQLSDEDGRHAKPVRQEYCEGHVLWDDGKETGEMFRYRSSRQFVSDHSVVSHPSDLECMGQTAAGVAGVTDCVQGLMGEV